jgi:hypothetical protein
MKESHNNQSAKNESERNPAMKELKSTLKTPFAAWRWTEATALRAESE